MKEKTTRASKRFGRVFLLGILALFVVVGIQAGLEATHAKYPDTLPEAVWLFLTAFFVSAEKFLRDHLAERKSKKPPTEKKEDKPKEKPLPKDSDEEGELEEVT